MAELRFEHDQSGSEINLMHNVKDEIEGKEFRHKQINLEIIAVSIQNDEGWIRVIEVEKKDTEKHWWRTTAAFHC